MGSSLFSVRGQGPWRGFTRLNVNDRGQNSLLKLENGYVSADGSEIRSMPGWVTLLDLTDANNQLGYGRLTKDIVKPIYATSPAATYQYKQVDAATVLSQNVLAKPTHFHAFEQCVGEVVVIGETRFREYTIGASGGGSVALLTVHRNSSTGTWELRFSGTIATTGTTTDAAGVGLNYTTTDSLIYCEGLETADAALNVFLNTNVNGKIHTITSLSSNVMVLGTTASGSATTTATAVTAGTVRKVLPNRSNSYDTTNGNDPYTATVANRPVDPDALTIWRAVGPLSLGDPEKQCLVGFVANRRRDVGDKTDTNIVDGWFHTSNTGRGISRRPMRKLPFRVCPEPSSDRIILAAPGYGCMFQIPMRVPINDAFPPGATTTGLTAPSNGLRDMPRALGIPKARIIEPSYMATMQADALFGSPLSGNRNYIEAGESFLAHPWRYKASGTTRDADFPDLSYGTWKLCVTYYDPATGEEGAPSDPVSINYQGTSVRSVTSLMAHIVHPGYVMGECLATHVKIYIAEPLSDVLKYYMTAPIDFVAGGNDGSTTPSLYTRRLNYMAGSSEYGLRAPGSPRHVAHWFCTFTVPWPDDGTLIENSLNAEIQPRDVNMPRGASCAKSVRGVLLSGGARGNFGRYYSLWSSKASIGGGQPDSSHNRFDELFVRLFGTSTTSTSRDGSPNESMLGIAGRCFPDAYQGVDVIGPALLPAGYDRATIDKVANRRLFSIAFAPYDPSPTFTTSGYGITLTPPSNNTEANYERLRLRNLWSEARRPCAETPVSPSASIYTRLGQDVFFVMPQGQLQVGDPSAPQYASKSTIKIFDSTQGEDITAIGRMGSVAFVCSKRETYSLTWYRSAIGEELNLVTNEHGCIAANSMVEFDGGLAWLGERGPIAVSGSGPDFIGASITDEFYGATRRYLTDSDGLMRHAWGCHDQSRGLVLWGLVTKDHTHTVTDEGATYSFDEDAPDEVLSRFPCDEILVWSYRANAFSTWRMPAGLEVLWMRPLRDERGNTRICFLAADGRIYAMDDVWNDRNGSIPEYGYTADAVTGDATFSVTGAGTATTTLSFTGANAIVDGDYLTGSIGTRNAGLLLAAGQIIEILDSKGRVTHRTTLSSVTSYSESGGTTVVEMAAAGTWLRDAVVRIGGRPSMTIVTSFMDGFAKDNMAVSGIQLRYGLVGGGHANVKATLIKPEIERIGVDNVTVREVAATSDTAWPPLGRGRTDLSDTGNQTGMRAVLAGGNVTGPEIALKLEITGSPQIRLQDVSLEVA